MGIAREMMGSQSLSWAQARRCLEPPRAPLEVAYFAFGYIYPSSCGVPCYLSLNATPNCKSMSSAFTRMELQSSASDLRNTFGSRQLEKGDFTKEECIRRISQKRKNIFQKLQNHSIRYSAWKLTNLLSSMLIRV